MKHLLNYICLEVLKKWKTNTQFLLILNLLYM